jgi:predicted negative regulator of RcsB-dependent stress response
MSLKENVDYVKEELNSEEKFLEGFVKVERFYKKNKLIMIAAVVIVVGVVIGLYTTKSMQVSNKLDANIAFNKVLENPKDNDAMNTLKDKSTQLYQVAQFIQASKENKTADIQVKYLKELVDYKKALDAKDINKLNDVSMQNDFLLKEFAIFNKALLQVNEAKFADAKATLKLIPEDSKVSDLVNVLNHYLVTK